MNLLQNNRILVVDDNPAIHSDFKKILHEGAAEAGHLDSAEAILFGDANRATARFSLRTRFRPCRAATGSP